MSKKEVIMLNISGTDKPGVTTSLTGILAKYNVNILDIGQAVIHDDLNLGILFEVPAKAESAPILKDLLYKGYELDIKLKFKPISLDNYSDWVSQQGKPRYIVTVLGRRLTADQISAVSQIIRDQELNIDKITRLSGRHHLEVDKKNTKAVVEFSVRGNPKDVEQMKQQIMTTSRKINADIAFQIDNIYRRNRRLVCFDMDSTLIQTEVIDELAKHAGVGEKVAAITEEAMRGEIDFTESFKKRVSLLKGLDEKVMKEIAENLPITEGAELLIRTLKQYGYKTAILSGGFQYFGNHLKNKLGFDYVFANDLEIENGKLTGKSQGDIVDGNKKAELLKLLAFKEDIHLNQVIAVGDGANDLAMLKLAGLGIAFQAKPKVKESAKHSLSTLGLDGILYFLGFREREIRKF
ncbi:phosphoserine phosphatase SerB [Bacteroidales bacterium]|nr:phosphoserine phosphatase SerB [Bacteroidales bacterium]